MKFKNNTGALGLLDNFNPWEFTVAYSSEHTDEERKKFMFKLSNSWPTIKELVKGNIQYISDPFYQAFDKAASKLSTVFDKEPVMASGVFISKVPGDSEYNTIFYVLKTSTEPEFNIEGTILIFSTRKGHEKPMLCVCVQRARDMFAEYISDTGRRNGLTRYTVFADILCLVLFLKYCQLETKVVEPGKKVHHVNEKYFNDTKYPIEVLDSTWFTTIVRSEGFKVDGHFRLQPYGPNNSMRKLIWIDPFEKHGYTRKAKILNE